MGQGITAEVPVSVSDNERMITQCLSVFNAPQINLRDPEQVKNRIQEYFTQCVELELRPGNMGLYAALGISRTDAFNAIHGKDKSILTPEGINILKRACRIMALYREQLGSKGKINPVTLIFWQKNFDGLKDSQSLEITAMDRSQSPGMSPDEIAKRIEQDIPIDLDDGEFSEIKGDVL